MLLLKQQPSFCKLGLAPQCEEIRCIWILECKSFTKLINFNETWVLVGCNTLSVLGWPKQKKKISQRLQKGIYHDHEILKKQCTQLRIAQLYTQRCLSVSQLVTLSLRVKLAQAIHEVLSSCMYQCATICQLMAFFKLG